MARLSHALYLFQPLVTQIRLRALMPCSDGVWYGAECGTDRGVSPESTRVALAVFLPKQTEWQREVSDSKAGSLETPEGPTAPESGVSDLNGKSVFAALLLFKSSN